ncbi:S41 family peptidase [Sphingomonas humi]|uniref:S41 family peptidase n=1 Tax=Sphingomonas humi TaxID=335630 RepID=A0ABP7RP19_9SPHN
MRLLFPAALLLASAAAFALVPAEALAQPVVATPPAAESLPFVASEAKAVVTALAARLERDYLLPSAGKAYAARLRGKLEAGGYARFASPQAFAQAVTADLQAVHPDTHLCLLPPAVNKEGERQSMAVYPTTSTIIAKGWLAPGTAYVGFSAFFGNEATLTELAAFLRQVRGARTLVIDIRKHRGGEFPEMNMLLAQLFGKETALLDMDTRESVYLRNNGASEEGPNLRRIDAPSGIVRQRHFAVPAADASLVDTKVYLLTSGKSASAAEHLALALKRTHRAALVGETTRGAGNYGSLADLGFGYSILVPDGRTYDPDTNRGWEGTGVAPDVAVPAGDALAKALDLAGVKVDAASALASLTAVRTSAR